MSSLIVKIVNFTLNSHPNADTLSLATPIGTSWQCVVKTENFAEGAISEVTPVNENEHEQSLAVYIPIDSMLPSPLATALGLPNVKDGKPYRIKTIKLRGEISQGLLVPLSTLIRGGYLQVEGSPYWVDHIGDGLMRQVGAKPIFEEYKDQYPVGLDVSESLQISKYVEPEPDSVSQRREPEGFIRYTDIENIKNFPDILVEGEEVVCTEKIHGANFRAGWILGQMHFTEISLMFDGSMEPGGIQSYEFIVGTRRTALKTSESENGDLITDNKWIRIVERYDLKTKLLPYPGFIVFGEVFGPGVQKLAYNESKVNLRLFDVWDGKRYLDYDNFVAFAQKIGVPTAPLLYRGEYSPSVLDLRSGKTVVGNSAHIREGIVIRPVKERWDKAVGRVLLKSISEDYLMGNFEGD